jgi:TIR domain
VPILFSTYSLADVLEAFLIDAREAVEKIPEADLVHEAEADLVEGIVERLSLEPVEIDRHDVAANPRRAPMPRSRDRDPNAPPVIGLEVRYYVEFTGDVLLLQCQPRPPYDLPHGRIEGSELVFSFFTRGDAGDTSADLEESLDKVEHCLARQLEDVTDFNEQLESVVGDLVEERVNRAEAALHDLEDRGFRIRRDADSTEDDQDDGHSGGGSNEYRFDVALSFAGEQREYVEDVAVALRAARVEVFYDGFAEDELWGHELAEVLGQIYGTDSRFVVLFVSSAYLQKAWPIHERQSAIAARVERREAMVLPVVFDANRVPGLPPSVGYLEAANLSPTELAARIMRRIGGGN